MDAVGNGYVGYPRVRSARRRRRVSARSAKGGLVDFFRVLVSIIIPPLGVFWQVGFTGQFWLNVVLTILGYVPGLIHAIYIILTRR
jgi:uncharacterized membrane protein YqaE (UPF0057 family)